MYLKKKRRKKGEGIHADPKKKHHATLNVGDSDHLASSCS